MKKWLSFVLISILIFAGCQSPTSENDLPNPSNVEYEVFEASYTPAHTTEEVRQLINEQPLSQDSIAAIRQFAIKSSPLLLSGQENDNYSPISLYIALAMAATGSEGETAEQVYQALGRPVDKDGLAEELAKVIERMNIETDSGRIRSVNSIWNQESFPFKDDYIQRLTEQFQASLFEVDFTDAGTGPLMSQWASDMTEGLIKPVFDDTSDYISVLFNALYFKESWRTPFHDEQTTADTFRGVSGDSQKDFLHAYNEARYINRDGVEGVILPFEVSNMIFLKKSGANPIDILKDYDLEDLIDSAGFALVDLTLPKFSYDNEYDLIDMLKAIGVVDLFDENLADLSGVSEVDLYVSSAKQQSFIGLDENGVEAAAVTSIVLETASAPVEQVELRLDEPFLFIIQSPEGLPLFIGTLTD